MLNGLSRYGVDFSIVDHGEANVYFMTYGNIDDIELSLRALAVSDALSTVVRLQVEGLGEPNCISSNLDDIGITDKIVVVSKENSEATPTNLCFAGELAKYLGMSQGFGAFMPNATDEFVGMVQSIYVRIVQNCLEGNKDTAAISDCVMQKFEA